MVVGVRVEIGMGGGVARQLGWIHDEDEIRGGTGALEGFDGGFCEHFCGIKDFCNVAI